MERLEVLDKFYTLAVQDGLFGRSHLFLNFGQDLDDPKVEDELKTPIGDGRDKISKGKVEKGSFKELKTVEPVWVYPTTYNAVNPLKENWYNPEVWWVLGKQVHRSRLPVFVGHPVPDLLKPAYSFGGLSLSQMVKPYVDIWLTTRQSVADLIHSFSVMVLLTDLQTLLQSGGGAGSLIARAELFNALRDNQGLMVVNKATEDFKNVSASLSGLHELQAQAQEHLCVPGDTLVETDRGQVPISEVTVDDLVMTRNGLAPIDWVGVTGHTNRLIEFTTEHCAVKVTGNHPMYLPNTDGFVSAEDVPTSATLAESRVWINANRLHFGDDDGNAASRYSRATVENKGVIKLNHDVPVYNLRVSDPYLHEFFANGICVSNCSVSRIPLVKLTGISPSGLNASSEGELRVYFDTISAYQNRFFRPHLTRVINFMQLSLFGEIDPEISWKFKPLWEMSEKEKSELQKSDADRDQVYVDMGAFAPEEIRKIKIDDPELPYTGLDAEDIPDLRSEEEEGLEPVGGKPDPLASAGPELGQRPEQGEAGGRDAALLPFGAAVDTPLADDAGFEESKHPRDKDGKFGSGSGASGVSAKKNNEKSSAPIVYPAGAPYKAGIKVFGLEHAEAQKKEWRKTAPKTVDSILQASGANQAALAAVCEKAAADMGTKFANPGVKSKRRLDEKIQAGRPPGSITDAVRGGFNVDTPEDGDKIIHILAQHFEIVDEGWQKNSAGYFDRKTMVRFENGQVGEI